MMVSSATVLRTPKPVCAVRREILTVTVVYAMPLGLAVVAAIFFTLRGLDPWPLILFAICFVVGILKAILSTAMRRRWDKVRDRKIITGSLRDKIVKEFPELSKIVFLVRGVAASPCVDGKFLCLSVRAIGSVATANHLPDKIYFVLAHEIRHLLVGRHSFLLVFRALRIGYVAAAIAIYVSLLLNVSVIGDDPYRIELSAFAVLAPLVAAILNSLLNLATRALEWRLEIDADASASEACRKTGRLDRLPQRENFPTPLTHPPSDLRMVALDDTGIDRSLWRLMLIGWCVAIAPLAASVAFAGFEFSNADLANEVLSSAYLIMLVALIIATYTTMRLGTVGSAKIFQIGAVDIFLNLYSTYNKLLSLLMCTVSLSIFIKIYSNAMHGNDSLYFGVILLIFLTASAFIYGRAASSSVRMEWVIGAGLLDASRVWSLLWLLRASGEFPYQGDLAGLGQAMMKHSDLLAQQAVELIQNDRVWVFDSTIGCLLVSCLIVIGVLGSRAKVKSSVLVL